MTRFLPVAALVALGLLVVGSSGASVSARAKPPKATITSAPSGTAASTTATIAFKANVTGASFQCSLDGGAYGACSSPATYTGLGQGSHTFSVFASTAAGGQGAPASATWTVDTVAPAAPTITGKPTDPSGSATATFSFSDAEAGVSFTCSLDGAAATACSSPTSYSALASGSHTFAVRARDAAGNVSPATSWTWTVAPVTPVAPPAPVFDSATSDSSGANATFAFSDADAGVTFRCSLDDGAPFACTSPQSVGPLAEATHTFAVRAVDGAGNQSEAVSETWTSSTPTAPVERLTNGNFESGTTGWAGNTATLSLASDGNTGPAAMRVTTAAGASTEFFLLASPRPVSSTVAGTTYTVTGSVRSDKPGRTVCTRIREYADSTSNNRLGEKTSCVTTTASWQPFPALAYTAVQSGGTLAFHVFESAVGAAAGDSFEVDGLSLSTPGQASSSPPVMVPSTAPAIAAAGDIACAPTDSRYNGGNGTGTACMQKATADLLGTLSGLSAVLPLGDEQYQCGELANFNSVYDPTWGRFKSLERPVAGNHEYGDTAACSPSNAAGYYSYFGAAAGDPTQGWYSYDVGSWHLIALNSNCAAVGGCDAGSPQETWLRADLAAHPAACVLAYWHHPRFSAGQTGDDPRTAALWSDLVSAHADLVLAGHDHTYQRYTPMNASGAAATGGVRELVVGTGGEEHHAVPLARSTLQVFDNTTFGVLKLNLAQSAYAGEFLPAPGTGSFTDKFTGSCA